MLPGIRCAAIAGDAAAALQVQLTDDTAFHEVNDPSDATASYSLNSGGTVSGTGISGYSWLLIGSNSDYEARATLLSGTLTSGTTGSWQALSTTRTWTRNRTTIGQNTASITLEIRRVSDSVVLDSATITLDALVN